MLVGGTPLSLYFLSFYFVLFVFCFCVVVIFRTGVFMSKFGVRSPSWYCISIHIEDNV